MQKIHNISRIIKIKKIYNIKINLPYNKILYKKIILYFSLQ